jgi:hypothetical protein
MDGSIHKSTNMGGNNDEHPKIDVFLAECGESGH